MSTQAPKLTVFLSPNLVGAGSLTDSSVAIQGGFKAARNSAIGCAILLAVIEGVGIGVQRLMAENTKLDVHILPLPFPILLFLSLASEFSQPKAFPSPAKKTCWLTKEKPGTGSFTHSVNSSSSSSGGGLAGETDGRLIDGWLGLFLCVYCSKLQKKKERYFTLPSCGISMTFAMASARKTFFKCVCFNLP